jgi:hypothetical protein
MPLVQVPYVKWHVPYGKDQVVGIFLDLGKKQFPPPNL